MDKNHLFDLFFASGLEEGFSPFLKSSSRKWGKNLPLKSSLLAAFLLLFSFLLSFFSPPSAHIFLVFVFFLVGIPALMDSFKGLLSLEIDIDLLMTLSAFVSLGIGRAFEGALLLVLFKLSASMEKTVTQKAKGAVYDLHQLSPTKAWVVQENGHLLEKSTQEIEVKTSILVKAGEIVPLDGLLLEGDSHYSIAHLTGEALPLKTERGIEIPAGAKILEKSVILQVTKAKSQSTLTKILGLITQASEAKPKAERFLDTWGEKYALAIIFLTVFFAISFPLFFNLPFLGFEGSIYRALTFMIAASPCALIIATPTAYLSAISSCARKGILLKGGVTLDALAKCTKISFDKTGTLTTGSLSLSEILPLNEPASLFSLNQALQVAFSLERNVVHPISEAILKKAEEKRLSVLKIENFETKPGFGLQGKVKIGNHFHFAFLGLLEKGLSFLPEKERTILEKTLQEKKEEKILALLILEKAAFLFCFTDPIRKEAKEAICALKKDSLKTLMLTGDHEINAKKVGSLLGIDEIYADLRPEKKLEIVEKISQKESLSMIGDGINDAPSLARASVGISMGKIGSSAAIEASDVILLQEDLTVLAWLLRKAKKTHLLVKQNLSFALLVILFASFFALYGFIPLWLAVLLHEGGTILVGLNSLRLLKR